MKRAFGRFLRIVAVVAAVIVLVVAAAVAFFFFDKPHVKRILERQLAKRTGISVRTGKLDYTLFPLHLTAESVDVGLEDEVQKVDLTLARLEARGDFWRLVRGLKPALDTIEAEGAVFRFRQKAPAKGATDYEAMVNMAADNLAWAGRISIVKGSLTASLLGWDANLQDGDVSLELGSQNREWTYSLRCSEIEVKDKSNTIALSSGLTSSGNLKLDSALAIETSLAMGAPRFAAGGIAGSPVDISIESSALLKLRTKEFVISRLKAAIPGLIELEGTANGQLDRGFSLQAAGTASLNKLENVAALLGPRLPAGLRQARLRGRAILSGKYSLRRSGGQTADSLDGSLVFEDLEFDQVFKGSPLHVRASGKVKANGPSQDPQVSAEIHSSLGPTDLGKVHFGGSDFDIAASGSKDIGKIDGLKASLKDLSLDADGGKRLSVGKAAFLAHGDVRFRRGSIILNSLEARFSATLQNLLLAVASGKRLSFDSVSLKGRAGLDLSRQAAVLDSVEVGLPGFPTLSASGRYALKRPLAAQARLETRALDLPSLRRLAAPFIPEGLAAWNLGGTADFTAELRRPSDSGAGWGFSGALTLAQVSLNDPSFTIASEGITAGLGIEGEYAPPLGIKFKGELDLSQGESLWKAVYIPWGKHPLRMTAAGRYDPGSGRMDGLAVRFNLPTIGEIGLNGSAATRPALSFVMQSDAQLALGPLYSLYAQAGVSDRQRLIIEGEMGTGLDIRKSERGFSVKGKVSLDGVNVERQLTKTVLHNIAAEVPVHMELGPDSPDSAETPLEAVGFLKIGQFRNSFLTLDSLDIPLRVGANAFSIEPVTAALYGGRVELGRTVIRLDLKSRLIQGAGSLALRDLDISRFPIRSPQFKLTGTLQADFPSVSVSPQRIAISGRGVASVFGGQVILRDLTVSEPFSPGRSVSLNLDLVDLDLKKVTDEVPFGEVTGLIRGKVQDLVITYGQPERFELLLESVPRKGLSQTFSLKAVDDLTVLSSGSTATAGTGRFWMRFIRGFRYRKLGIVSTLRNDTFTLNGTIHEGGVEYLVKRTPFLGISVVNRFPQNVISFKEMMSRLKRIGQSENIPAKKEETK